MKILLHTCCGPCASACVPPKNKPERIFTMADEFYGDETITLTDEDGKEINFSVLGIRELDGVTYYALLPLEDNEEGEYVILKIEEDENGDEILVTVDDDDEFDRIADVFEDELFSEIDYDDDSDGE